MDDDIFRRLTEEVLGTPYRPYGRRPEVVAAPAKVPADVAAVLYFLQRSAQAMRGDAVRALALAELGLDAAADVEGVARRSRAEGFCWAYIADARRASRDLAGAEAAFAEAWRLWHAKKPRGLDEALPQWRVHNFEASLRRDQRRFHDALDCLDLATAHIGSDDPAVRMLLQRKSRLLQILAEAESGEAADGPEVD